MAPPTPTTPSSSSSASAAAALGGCSLGAHHHDDDTTSSSTDNNNKKPRVASQHPDESLLERLPPELLHRHVLAALAPRDVAQLLQLCKGMWRLLLPATPLPEPSSCGDWVMDADALLKLLSKTPGLRRLRMQGWSAGSVLVQTIRSTFQGAEVEELKLGYPSDGVIHALVKHLGEGGLPLLQELDLPLYSQLRTPDGDVDIGPLLAAALEARQALGLPPIIRMPVIPELDADSLRRIWACSPPTHISIEGDAQATMLAQQLAASPFVSLRSLKVDAHRIGGVHLASLVQALAQNRAPALEELRIQWWSTEAHGSLLPLGHALQQGVLPRFSSFTMRYSRPSREDFASLVDGLRAPHMRVRKLDFGYIRISQQDVACLAAAMRAGGGLGHLRSLTIDGGRGATWDPVMAALVGPAPCSQTLTALELDRSALTDGSMAAFFGGLGSGCFPSLESLVLRKVGDNDVHELAEALLASAQNKAPSPLKRLKLDGDRVSLGWLLELSPVFAADGLPRLTSLSLFKASEGDEDAADGSTYFDVWTALGGKIKLDLLSLFVDLSYISKKRLLKALANPDFCPCLRKSSVWVIDVIDVKAVQAQLRECRRKTRNALAEAEAVAAIAALDKGGGGGDDE